jgi:branched-chain amino acid transport system permease protein
MVERAARNHVASVGARGWRVPALLGVLAVIAGLLPLFGARDDLLTLLFRICLFVTLAQSWNILAGFTGQTNLGHAAFFGIGALVARTLWLSGMPFPLAFLLAGLAATAFAMIIGVPTFRLRGAYFAIGTLGMAEMLRIIAAQGLPLITTLAPAEIVSYSMGARYQLALGLAIATTVTALLLRRSALGLGLLAVRADEDAARASGVPVLVHKLLALALCSFFAGLAGGVFAFQQVSYYPAAPFGPLWTFDAVLITYAGGLGTISGPIIGAIFFILVQEQLALTFEEGQQIIFGVLFIVVVLAFPGGLIEGWSRLQRWLSARLGAKQDS